MVPGAESKHRHADFQFSTLHFDDGPDNSELIDSLREHPTLSRKNIRSIPERTGTFRAELPGITRVLVPILADTGQFDVCLCAHSGPWPPRSLRA
jgi:hypothetical protein